MRNVTITMPPEVLRWTKVEAAKRDMSVSKFVCEMLSQRMEVEEGYDLAMKEFTSRKVLPLKSGDNNYPDREELY